MNILLISPPHEPTVTGAETITRNHVLTEPLPLDVFYEEFVKLYDRSFSLQKQVRRLFPALLRAKADHRARFGIGSFLEVTMAQLELKKLGPLVKEFHRPSDEILAAALQHTPGQGAPWAPAEDPWKRTHPKEAGRSRQSPITEGAGRA